MHVFYVPELGEDLLTLSEEESKHAIRVLRLKKGEELHLADGKGMQCIATIIDDNVKKCSLQIKERIHHKPRTTTLHIAIAPTKNFDRIEWFIEKATEMGIEEISFIECTRGERNKINLDRCIKTAVSAMKQSKQWWLPQINNIVIFQKFLETTAHSNATKLIAWCETDKQELILKHINTSAPSKHLIFLIGPEGDFTENEILQAQQNRFIPVSLGAGILRTETAALYVCALAKN